MSALSFTVAGTPAPQGSKRYLGRANGKGVMVESSKKVAPWRADVRAAAEKELIDLADLAAAEGKADEGVFWNSPLTVHISFRLERPKGHWRTGRNAHLLRDNAPTYPAGKPDVDKLSRAVLDALTGMVWRDDSQVVFLSAAKYYGIPGADIIVKVAP